MNRKKAMADEMANLAKQQGRNLGLELGECLQSFARIDRDLTSKNADLQIDTAAAYARGVLEGLLLQLNGVALDDQEAALVLNRLHAMVQQAVSTSGGVQ
ncbi:hypothetical protein [Chitinibacter tainanensis]|uniref:hypothetical protein n=1 Tax=Chitinibacter tainanensis TaxID=230667 RepID=UPI002357351B|nr:hypothetical protein [Chitinibacter tainanensis]